MLAEDYSLTQRESLSKSFADFKARYNLAKRKQVGLLNIYLFLVKTTVNDASQNISIQTH